MNKRTQERKSFLSDSVETADAEGKIVYKSVRFEPRLADLLGDYVHEKKKRTKTSLDAEVQRAVREMLSREADGHQPAPAPIAGSFKRENDPWHDKLEKILNSGSARDIVGIQSNLEWAVNDIASRNPKRKQA